MTWTKFPGADHFYQTKVGPGGPFFHWKFRSGGPRFLEPKFWWKYQQASLSVLALSKELSICNHRKKKTPQLQQCRGSQVFLLETIPCLQSWRTCTVMQRSMEIKLTMVFIPPVLRRWSKPMYQRRLSKERTEQHSLAALRTYHRAPNFRGIFSWISWFTP